MKRKALIVGIKSYKLSSEEKLFLKKHKPWGVIIFSRNIKHFTQLKKLVSDIKLLFKDKNYPILIDQEGGRVSRLNNILNFSQFSQKYFGNLYVKNKNDFANKYKIYIDATSNLLKNLGININTVPVLDLLNNKNNHVIGDRSFSNNHKYVTILGKHCIKFFNSNNIATVIKHIPGHGSTSKDSHFDLPINKRTEKELKAKDFIPFKNCNSFFAMTAHVLYKNIDPKFTATHSKIIIKNIIRKHMNFNGILISDDISMKALRFGLKKNTTMALDAGCNLILHCNGNIKEMKKIAKIVPQIDNFILKKTSQFYKFLR